MIIGTAGHIDHGKTALIRALTGIDTDRLKEEKERGISIDLGFAHFDAEGAESAGVVDVPGHERFIRNMLAGAHGVDLVLLVVAADDGVMPQTEEHVDILHLLGVEHGVVAVTKVDLVDAARRGVVHEEVEILLDGTTLEGSPVFEVSAVTGEGVEALRAALGAALARIHRPEPAGAFRLPVDRAFAMHGHGTVVTGTAVAGEVAVDATVRILPGGEEARVRSVQVHGEEVRAAHWGQRIALNLGGVERAEIARGHVVCDPEIDRATDCLDAWVELRPAARRPLRSHSLVRVYLGTAEVLGKVVWLDGRADLSPKRSTLAQLVLREPIVALGGDRFILRDQTARATIGGGRVLFPFPRRARKRPDPRLAALGVLHEAQTHLARLGAALSLDPAFGVAPELLAAATGLRVALVRRELARHPDVRALPEPARAEAYTTMEKWERLCSGVRAELARLHGEQPAQPGMEMESLRSKLCLDVPPKIFRTLIAELERDSVVVREQSVLRLPSHRTGLGESERRAADQLVARLEESGFTPPDGKALATELRLDEKRYHDLLARLEREGRVARVSPDLCYAAATVEKVRGLVREHVAAHGQIDAAALRDLIGASRKFSIALLTYFDRTGFTMRVGDIRKLRAKG